MRHRARAAVASLAVVALSAACTPQADSDDTATSRPSAATTTATEVESPPADPTSPTTTAEPGDQRKPLPPVTSPVSLPALMRESFDGRQLRTVGVLGRYSTYTRYAVRYLSGDLSISGIMNVPDGKGPFPVLVLCHGYIDPAYYVTGQGLAREQDYLARQGYVVLHTDYRNHATSTDDPRAERQMRLGYTADVINAVRAVKQSRLPYVDGDRVGLLGRSMGGGVVLNALVTRPGLVDAATIYASVSSRAIDNFNRWIRDDPGRSALSDYVLDRWGEPRDNPSFWRGVSSRPYFGRISEPVLMHHGTMDESCPLPWARQTFAALEANDVAAKLHLYPGEMHTFYADWQLSIRRTAAFFDRQL